MRKLVMLVGLVAVGCGSDSFQPSAPGGTPINQLSAQQAITLCTEATNYSRGAWPPATLTEFSCREAGIRTVLQLSSVPSDAQTRAACKVGYDLCKIDPPVIPPAEPVAQFCANAMANVTTCLATVDQYAACINAVIPWLSASLPPCDQLTTAKVIQIAEGTVPPPPACDVLEATCPTLAYEEEAMMSSALKLMKR